MYSQEISQQYRNPKQQIPFSNMTQNYNNQKSNNYLVWFFLLLSLILVGYYGYYIYKKYNTTLSQDNNLESTKIYLAQI